MQDQTVGPNSFGQTPQVTNNEILLVITQTVMTRKIIQRNTATSGQLPDDIHPVLRRVYAARAIDSIDELDYSLDTLLPPSLLGGMDKAVALLQAAIIERQRILVVGDFDADGATSCALSLRALRALGAADVHYLVPNRFEYGYGLTPEIVDVATQYSPDLLITVDNGISSIEGVKAANAKGMQVVVTDHHLPGRELPEAAAIVNPNQPGCEFESKSIAGVGVAFYLMLAVRSALRDRQWFGNNRTEPNMAQLLDIVALGTVADVVPLDTNNRILVEQGIRRIRSGKACAGIRALFHAAGKDANKCSSVDLGFFIGPRLNAAGRLEDMSAGIECLITDSDDVADSIASELHALNNQRKQIEQGMLQQAMDDMNNMLETMQTEQIHAGLCLYDPGWHQGVIGLLASRVKERFHRPVVAFADASDDADNTEIKGSARSIKGLHIRDVLDTIATRHPSLINKFGGHAMAAGLSIHKENFAAFKQAFEDEVGACLSDDELEEVVETDGSIEPEEMTLETAAELEKGGPWGQHFPEPLFDNTFEILNWKIVGEKHLKLQLRHAGGEGVVDAIAFNTLSDDLPSLDKVHAAYRMSINEFRNNRSLQLIVDCVRPTE